MPARRELTMRQLRQLLRLHHDGVSARRIACELGVARSTIRDNLKRAVAAGLTWPLAADLTDDVLEQRLFSCAGVRRGIRRKPEPDWSLLARELKRPGVSLLVLWEEYSAVHPDGYRYSRRRGRARARRFCAVREWRPDHNGGCAIGSQS
jgi:transposase